MFLAVQIKEACNKPKHLNPVAVYDTYVGKSTEETKRNSLCLTMALSFAIIWGTAHIFTHQFFTSVVFPFPLNLAPS